MVVLWNADTKSLSGNSKHSNYTYLPELLVIDRRMCIGSQKLSNTEATATKYRNNKNTLTYNKDAA
jgi:hypothetical protein